MSDSNVGRVVMLTMVAGSLLVACGGATKAPIAPIAVTTQPQGLLLELHGCPAGYRFVGQVDGPDSAFAVCQLG